MATNWTDKEIKILENRDLSHAEAATVLNRTSKVNRTYESVEKKRRMLKITGCKATATVPKQPTSVAQDIALHDEKFWQRQHNQLQTKYETLTKNETVVARLVANIRELAPKSYQTAPAIHIKRKDSGKAQSAVLMLSDTHIGKQVKPNQTLSFGRYDFETFMARLHYLEESIISIAENHINTDITELVIAMLGDMLDGALAHSNEVGQVDPIFNQFYAGAHVMAQFIRRIAPYFPVVRIFDTVGNHTRFQNQRKMPTKNRYSNFDNFFYALVRELVRDIKNIEWKIDSQPYEIFEVQGFTFFAAHGDSLRGGDKNLGIPNHAVGRLVSTATQLMNKYGRKAPNYYLVGHLHRDIVLPHATGSFIVNGGFPGIDEFGLSEMFTPADPSQKLFFVHPQYGRTASYDISLKFAEVGAPPYVVPAGFDMH